MTFWGGIVTISVVHLHTHTDMRKSYCYRNFYSDNNTCDGELTFNMTQKMCCCSYNIGRAWNKPCKQCPVPSTSEYGSHTHTHTHTYRHHFHYSNLWCDSSTAEFATLCGSERPGYYIDIYTGQVMGMSPQSASIPDESCL